MRYLKRAMWLEGVAAAAMGVSDPDPREVASFAIESRERWSKSNWRQVKASLIYRYSEMGTPEAQAAVRSLSASSQTPCLRKASKTSALRQKSISEADLAQIVAAIRCSRSKYSQILESWLVLGSTFGLRPHEWCQSVVVWMRPSDGLAVEEMAKAGVEEAALPGVTWSDVVAGAEVPSHPSAQEDSPGWFLRVRNAKHTNGRAHGSYRHLDMATCPDNLLQATAEFARMMTSVQRNGLYETYYEGCQRLLHRINKKQRRAGQKLIQLYSVRHKFISVAKANFSKVEVGAMVGHATDKTAGEHYGRRAWSGSSAHGVRPLSIEVDRVVRKNAGYPAELMSKKKGPAPMGGS